VTHILLKPHKILIVLEFIFIICVIFDFSPFSVSEINN